MIWKTIKETLSLDWGWERGTNRFLLEKVEISQVVPGPEKTMQTEQQRVIKISADSLEEKKKNQSCFFDDLICAKKLNFA